MNLEQLTQYLFEHKEWLAITLGGIIAWLFENRRAARKSKSEEYLQSVNTKLKEATANFQFQESLRAELRQHNKDLRQHIKDSDVEMEEMRSQTAIVQTTLQQIERFITLHKFEQRDDLRQIQELNDESIAASRSMLASIDLEDWDTLKELVRKEAPTGDEIAVILMRVIARNESVDNRYEVPQKNDILV